MWVVKAELKIGEQVFNGLAQEVESDEYSSVNHTSALENCETSAIGRAAAMAGVGLLDSIASADEMNKAMNRVKSSEKKAESVSTPEIQYTHTIVGETAPCKKCGKISEVQKLRKPTKYGATHLLACECGEKTWLYPGQVKTEATETEGYEKVADFLPF